MKELDFQGKKIAILGYGIENQSMYNWLIRHGANTITICDHNIKLKVSSPRVDSPRSVGAGKRQRVEAGSKKVKTKLGPDYLKNLEQFDIIFRTPGISYLSPEIQKALRLRSGQAKKKGVEISSQIQLFFDLCPAKIIGVTGTKGKGTTASLIYEILEAGKKIQDDNRSRVYLGGNIGNAPIDFLDQLTPYDWVVLELSSFQLQGLDKSPHVAVVLDIKSDHLDYHKSQKEYIEAKTNIVRHQRKSDFTVVNLDYLTSYKFVVASPAKNNYYFSRRKSVDLGCFVRWINEETGKIILRTEKEDYVIADTQEVTLRGRHNLENICAAVTAGYLAGAKPEFITNAVRKFKGLEHRLEFVSEKKGVKFYNDSFSTTPDTTIAAINSFRDPIVLLLGGSEKNADYSLLVQEIAASSVKTIISIGQTGERIIKAIESRLVIEDPRFEESGQYGPSTSLRAGNLAIKNLQVFKNCQTMQEAVNLAHDNAKSGDVVLLSPASASFDQFINYKDRGYQFKKAVDKLI